MNYRSLQSCWYTSLASDGIGNRAEFIRAGEHPIVQHPLFVRELHCGQEPEYSRDSGDLRLGLLDTVSLAKAANVPDRGKKCSSLEYCLVIEIHLNTQ